MSTLSSTQLATIDAAIAQVAAGRPIIVVDDENRENEGDLIMSAALCTPDWMGFIIRHTSGVVCTPMSAQRAAAFDLPTMVEANEDPKGTWYTVSCDAAAGVSTGISATDRATTARLLADPASTPAHFNRPGHAFPLIARAGGVRERPGHTEAGVEFTRLARAGEVAVIAEIVHDNGEPMRLPSLVEFGQRHGLLTVSIAELIGWLNAHEQSAQSLAQPTAEPGAFPAAQPTTAPLAAPPAAVRSAPAAGHGVPSQPAAAALEAGEPVRLPTAHGIFTATAYSVDGVDHVVLTSEGRASSQEPAHALPSAPAPLVRLHSECLTGDVFSSYRCDCGEQLDAALQVLSEHGGHLVYLRGHEGRGIGLANKLRAYALQEQGFDTVDANTALGFPAEARDWNAAALILRSLGIDAIRLITNNPAKVTALQSHGILVTERVDASVRPRPENARYLKTKQSRMHHTPSRKAS